jgi:hypothetical protein
MSLSGLAWSLVEALLGFTNERPTAPVPVLTRTVQVKVQPSLHQRDPCCHLTVFEYSDISLKWYKLRDWGLDGAVWWIITPQRASTT